MRFLAICTLAAAAVFAFIPSLHAATCESLGGLSLANTKIALAQIVPAGDFKIPGSPPNPRPLNELPAFCRVAADITPTPDSDIKIEVWLPVTSFGGYGEDYVRGLRAKKSKGD